MMPKPLFISIEMQTDLETLWQLTQTPDVHERWDLRFSSIEYLPKPHESSPQRFRYATRIGAGLIIEGWGESVAARLDEHQRTSSLRFGSASRLSLISEGSGYWKYEQRQGAVHFETGYNYQTRFGWPGRMLDCVFRPIMGWATAWSFDRLRLWIERGIDPSLSATRAITHSACRLALALVFAWHGLIPKLLLHHPEELRLIERAGFSQELAPRLLTIAGVLELCLAVALIGLWTARWMYTVTAAVLTGLLIAALVADPGVATDPFTPVSFTLALLALCLAGWVSCTDLPSARHCRRRPESSPKESAP